MIGLVEAQEGGRVLWKAAREFIQATAVAIYHRHKVDAVSLSKRQDLSVSSQPRAVV